MLDIYQQEIIERSQHPLFGGELPDATHTAEGANLSCGDIVHFTLVIQDGVIMTIRHKAQACAVCTASADILAEYLTGKSMEMIKNINADFITTRLNIPLSPIRLKCALLPGETLQVLQPKTN